MAFNILLNTLVLGATIKVLDKSTEKLRERPKDEEVKGLGLFK